MAKFKRGQEVMFNRDIYTKLNLGDELLEFDIKKGDRDKIAAVISKEYIHINSYLDPKKQWYALESMRKHAVCVEEDWITSIEGVVEQC